MKPVKTLILALTLFTAGCLESPLLNHLNASPSSQPAALGEPRGCSFSFPKSKLCASISWTQEQSGEDLPGAFTLRFWKTDEGTENGPFVRPAAEVKAKLFMPSMGHGSSPITVKPAQGPGDDVIPGVYECTNVYFSMPGDWELKVQLREGTTLIEEAKITLRH